MEQLRRHRRHGQTARPHPRHQKPAGKLPPPSRPEPPRDRSSTAPGVGGEVARSVQPGQDDRRRRGSAGDRRSTRHARHRPTRGSSPRPRSPDERLQPRPPPVRSSLQTMYLPRVRDSRTSARAGSTRTPARRRSRPSPTHHADPAAAPDPSGRRLSPSDGQGPLAQLSGEGGSPADQHEWKPRSTTERHNPVQAATPDDACPSDPQGSTSRSAQAHPPHRHAPASSIRPRSGDLALPTTPPRPTVHSPPPGRPLPESCRLRTGRPDQGARGARGRRAGDSDRPITTVRRGVPRTAAGRPSLRVSPNRCRSPTPTSTGRCHRSSWASCRTRWPESPRWRE